MPSISLKNVSVQFSAPAKMRNDIGKSAPPQKVGGLIGLDQRDRPVINALNHINLEVSPGDRVGIVGANGSGKTTMLRTMSGILEPTGGTVHVRGKTASLISVAFGFDENATGRANIYRRGLVMGLGRRDIEARMDEILEFSEIERFIDMPLYTYSTGMRLRLGFAITTAVDADVVLMDEWIGAGDKRFVDRSRTRLNTLIDQSSILVICSHNHNLLRKQCNCIAVMWRGHLLDYGELNLLDAINKADGGVDDVYQKEIEKIHENS